ncbi:MAG TPA: ADP-ribosylglycohydrolase family protein [Clostridia bacterium]|nr:ADP-ribosylglycohydrolase family protein [Clostridia bacterium]
MDDILKRERFRYSLLAGAIGDALGYPIEFNSLGSIKEKYGSGGLQDLELNPVTGTAIVSDDTQMTLFTASGLLWAQHNQLNEQTDNLPLECLYYSYLRWLYTQNQNIEVDQEVLAEQDFERAGAPRIMDIKELYFERAPGITCLEALESGNMGSIDNPINDSKGCGGVMRVAPVGLFLNKTPKEAFRVAAEAAAITHGHPTGYLSSGLFAAIIAYLVNGSELSEAIEQSLEILGEWEGYEETEEAILDALELSVSSVQPEEAIRKLGKGFIAEQALAIALYCALKESDPYKALLISVNHSGDSDSTGSICGNILGAMHGIESVPEEWVKKLEMSDFILSLADELYAKQ